MAKCYKFSITNTATTWVTIGYHSCDSNLVVSQEELFPGQTKYVWAYENTVTSAFQNGYNINNDTLNPPILNVIAETTESTLIVSSPSGSTEYYYTVFNYRTNRSTGLIGLELDRNVWSNWDNYPLTNSGYVLFFGDSSDNVIVHFMDYTGNIIDTYSANTSYYDYDDLDGKIVYFDDRTNGLFKYFDGKNVRTYTYDSSDLSISIQWDWDAVTSNDCFAIMEHSTSANTDTLKVINGSTITDIKTIDRSGTSYISDVFLYNNGNFIVLSIYDISGYTSFEFYTTSGTLLDTLDLTGEQYDYRNVFFYGTNKFGLIIFNDFDSNIDYIIASFDGRSNTLLSTTHERGTNYQGYNTYSQSKGIGPDSSQAESLFITLYHEIETSYEVVITDYLDIIKIFDNTTSIDTYTFTSGVTAYHVNCVEVENNTLFFPIYDVEDSLTMMSITPSGNVDYNVSTGITYYSYWCGSFGDYSYLLPWTGNTNEGGIMYIFNTDGTLFTEVTIDATSGGWEYDYTSDIFMYIHYDAGIVKYFNKNKVLTTISGNFNSYETSNNYFKSNFKYESSILIYNDMTGAARIINPRNVSKQFTLPDNLDYSIRVGRNSVMFTYINSSTEFVNIAVYDLDGNLLNNITTTDTTWNDNYLINDRGYVQSWSTNDAVGNIRMITPNLIQFSIVTNVDNAWYTFNDYVWWND